MKKNILIIMFLMFLILIGTVNSEIYRSKKRGICANKLYKEDIEVLQKGVSWWYNWYFKSDDIFPGMKMEFIPMVWGANPEYLKGFEELLKSGFKPQYVMVINEPNLKGQAYLKLKECAELYQKIEEVAKKYNVEVAGPHMALGSAEKDSITDYDPIEKKTVTHTYMVPYLKAFFYYLGGEGKTKYIGVHPYGDINEVKWLIGMLAKEFPNHKIWVSEFAWWRGKDEDELINKYMIEAIEIFESATNVVKYAWFKERTWDWSDPLSHKLSILQKEPGKLTKVGKIYVNMPYHNPDLYFAVPGKIEAGCYAYGNGMKIKYDSESTNENEMFYAVHLHKTGDWAEYNIDVSKSGKYNLFIKIGSENPVDLEILVNKSVVAKIKETNSPQEYWRVLKTSLKLNKGKNVIKLVFNDRGPKLKYLEFK
jgi:hypothetical protein